MPEPTIKVKVTADTAGLQKGLKEGAGMVQIFAKTVVIAGNSVGEKFTPKAKEGEEQTKKFSNVVKGFALGAGLMLVGTIMKGVSAMTNFVKGGVMYAAQVQQMSGTLALLGRQQGVSAREMDNATKSIRDVGIETGAAQQMLANFTRMGLESADAVRVAGEARDLATVSGANTTQTALRILHGVQTRQTDVLRMAGVNVGNLDTAYRKYADSIDTTVSALTEEQKTRAIMNAISEEAAKVQGAAAEADKNAIKQLGSLSRIIREIALELGRPFVGAFSSGVLAVKKFTDEILKMIREGGELRPFLDKIGAILNALSEDFDDLVDDSVKRLPEIAAQLSLTADAAVQFGGRVAGTVATIGDVVTALAFPFRLMGKNIAMTFDVMIKGGLAAASAIKAIGSAMIGNIDDAVFYAKATEEALNQAFSSIGDTFKEVWIEDLGEAGRAARDAITGVSFALAQTEFVDRFTGGADEVVDALGEITDAAAVAAGAAAQAEQGLVGALKTAIAQQLQARWDQLDQERRIAAQRAQIQSQFESAMATATANYNSGVAQAAINHGKTMIDIQREYEKAVDAIMRQFEMSREEAVRSRDAIALVNAENERDQALAQAEENRGEQVSEASQAYQEQLQSLQVALAEQQAAARAARDQQSAALAQQIAEEAVAKARAAEREKMLQEVNQAASLASLQQFLNAELRATYAQQLAEYTAAVQHAARMQAIQASYQGVGVAAVTSQGPGRPGRRRSVPSYQTGTDFVPQTGMYQLERGEAVVPARENRRGGARKVVDQSGWTFNGPISEADKQWFRDEAQRMALTTYDQINRD